MIIRELKLDHFRNLADTSLEFPEKGQLIIGDNGQGKTNLLEAIYYLTLLKSFRIRNDTECIRFGESHFLVQGCWTDDHGQRERVSVGYDSRRKKVALSGIEKKKVSEAFGIFKSVIFTPDDILIIQGGPALRRRYLDIVLSIGSPLYLERLKRYKRALCSRNMLLRKNSVPAAMITPWEEEMAVSGAFVACRRFSHVRQIAPIYEKLFLGLSSGEKASMAYRSDLLNVSAVSPEDLDETRVGAAFANRLEKNRRLDQQRGTTLSGPQTDDILFAVEGRPLRNYGSQGQKRTAVICLKMAEAEQIRLSNGVQPVLLLDDIFSELDRRRSENLLQELVERHQSFITAPRKEVIFDRLGHLPIRKIERGVISDG